MENGKLLNMGPLGMKENIIKQFHIRKEQDQNHIYVLRLLPIFHTWQLKNPPKMKRIISLLDKIESLWLKFHLKRKKNKQRLPISLGAWI